MDIYKERILPLFQSSGIPDAELERKIGIKPKKINDWSSGRTKSYNKYIPQIAAYFHVSTDYLLGKTDDPTPPSSQKEQPTPISEDGLNEKDKRLISWFRSLPLEKQKAILISQDAPEDLID